MAMSIYYSSEMIMVAAAILNFSVKSHISGMISDIKSIP